MCTHTYVEIVHEGAKNKNLGFGLDCGDNGVPTRWKVLRSTGKFPLRIRGHHNKVKQTNPQRDNHTRTRTKRNEIHRRTVRMSNANTRSRRLVLFNQPQSAVHAPRVDAPRRTVIPLVGRGTPSLEAQVPRGYADAPEVFHLLGEWDSGI